MHLYQHFFKRLIDLLVSGLALLILAFPLAIVTFWLHYVNKGAGAFFRQDRPGKNGKIFRIVKFKTMTDQHDADGKLLPDTLRITRVGRFVRSTSIDELPQLWNVFKGDMSLIGPRPLLPRYMPWYTERESHRHDVRPGISGLAQTHGRNHLSWDKKLELDVLYVENISILNDIKIIFKTIKNVFESKDVEVVPSGRFLDVERKNLIKKDIIIREIEEDDLCIRVNWMNNPAVYSTMHYEIPITYENTLSWYKRNVGNDARCDVIFEGGAETVIAMGGLTSIEDGAAELYIFVNPLLQGHGFGKICLNKLCYYGFKKLNLREIFLYTDEDNYNAVKLYERQGFMLDKTFCDESHDKVRLYYKILATDYLKNYNINDTE